MEKESRIKEITLIKTSSERVSVELVAKIKENGDLVLEGYDIGPFVEEQFGDSDYEYWLTIDQSYKETILLWLIKERFASDSEFRAWLTEKGIPSHFENWR